MDVNYWAVFSCGVLSMVIGAVWYGPLFGRLWLEVNNVSPDDLAKREEMQRNAGPLYAVQFVLSLLELSVLAFFINGWSNLSGVENALWIWLGFVMPTIAGLAMWNARPAKARFALFFISAGYQLVSLTTFGWILDLWP